MAIRVEGFAAALAQDFVLKRFGVVSNALGNAVGTGLRAGRVVQMPDGDRVEVVVLVARGAVVDFAVGGIGRAVVPDICDYKKPIESASPVSKAMPSLAHIQRLKRTYLINMRNQIIIPRILQRAGQSSRILQRRRIRHGQFREIRFDEVQVVVLPVFAPA